MTNSVTHRDFLRAAKPPPVSAGCAAALIPSTEIENCCGWRGARYASRLPSNGRLRTVRGRSCITIYGHGDRWGGVHILSKRFQRVNVVTLSTLREHLEAISSPDCRFTIEKVRGDRITRSAARI
jgi:hypothetical protein